MSLADETVPPGMGAAAFLLMIGLLSRLKARGILETDDLKMIADEAMLSLEQFGGLSVPELRSAHSLTSALMDIFSGAAHPPTPPS
jgi:hypothetical protein